MILAWTTPQTPLGEDPTSVVSAVKVQTLGAVISEVAASGSDSGQVKKSIQGPHKVQPKGEQYNEQLPIQV